MSQYIPVFTQDTNNDYNTSLADILIYVALKYGKTHSLKRFLFRAQDKDIINEIKRMIADENDKNTVNANVNYYCLKIGIKVMSKKCGGRFGRTIWRCLKPYNATHNHVRGKDWLLHKQKVAAFYRNLYQYLTELKAPVEIMRLYELCTEQLKARGFDSVDERSLLGVPWIYLVVGRIGQEPPKEERAILSKIHKSVTGLDI